MKNLVDGRDFRNLKDKVKRYGKDDILAGNIFTRMIEVMTSMEGQILTLNKEIERFGKQMEKFNEEIEIEKEETNV